MPQLLKLEWWSLNRDLQKAKDADAEGLVTEAEIEEAAYLREEAARRSLGGQNPDERMVDAMEHEEDAELDALVSSYLNGETPASSDRTENPTDSPRRSLSDDEDYDAIFMDFLSREQRQAAQQPSSQMDTS